MSAFRALTINAVRSSLRNRVALFFTLGLAVLFMVIFGELFSGNSFKVTFGVVDADGTSQSRQFISALGSISGVTIKRESDVAARDDLKNNNVDLIVEIPRGFGDALTVPGSPTVAVQTLQGSQTSSTASIGDQLIGPALKSVLPPEASPKVSLAPPQSASVNNISAIDYFLPAMIAYIILQSGINYVAIGLADLRARKVLRRFRVTPVLPAQILSAQIVGGALTVALQLVVLIALGLGVFHARTYGSWAVAVVPMVLGVAAFVGIGFLLTSAARTSESARGLSSMVAFPMMFLSGVFFPITTLPSWIQTAVHILPLTWLTDALHQVMNNGAALADVALDCLVLAAWALLTFALATWRFRWD
jgi:ABC-2 type transport system permease protein